MLFNKALQSDFLAYAAAAAEGGRYAPSPIVKACKQE